MKKERGKLCYYLKFLEYYLRLPY